MALCLLNNHHGHSNVKKCLNEAYAVSHCLAVCAVFFGGERNFFTKLLMFFRSDRSMRSVRVPFESMRNLLPWGARCHAAVCLAGRFDLLHLRYASKAWQERVRGAVP